MNTNTQYHPGKSIWLPTHCSLNIWMIALLRSKSSDLERLDNVEDVKHTEFSVDDDGVVWFEDRLCVPNDQALREKVMTEDHSSPFTYSISPPVQPRCTEI
ncbi:hypothetical protein Tco_0139215 [Tanacetum coccineum]